MAEFEAPKQPSLPPDTTEQQDVTRAGQRRVNMLWERTQAAIAIFVVLATLGIATWLAVYNPNKEIPTIFSAAFGMIVGFYFARTNHQAIGGIGHKPTQEYEGR